MLNQHIFCSQLSHAEWSAVACTCQFRGHVCAVLCRTACFASRRSASRPVKSCELQEALLHFWDQQCLGCRREAAAFNVDRGWLFAALWRLLDPAVLQPVSDQQATTVQVRPVHRL